MIEFTELDAKIQHGYLLIVENHEEAGCDDWLATWEEIKQLMSETDIKGIYELDEKYPWSGLPSELVADMKRELRDAGIKNPKYQEKRETFCQEITKYMGDENQQRRNKGYVWHKGYYYIDVDDADVDLSDWPPTDAPTPYIRPEKIGRNKQCPCGSGQKHKRCCGTQLVV